MAASMDNKISDDRRNREGPDNNGADVPVRRGSMKEEMKKIIEELPPDKLRLLYVTALELKK